MTGRLLASFLLLLSLAGAFAHPVSAQSADSLLTLEEAIRLALDNNYDIRISRNEAQIARNDYTRGNAGYLPSIGLTAQNSQSALLSTREGVFGGSNAVDVGAGLSYTIFSGGSRSARYERLGVLSEQGRTGAEVVAEGTLADVVTLYYGVAREQQQLAVNQEAVAISEERVRIAEVRLNLGSASEMEARRAQVDLNADRAAFLRQEVVLSNTKADLNQILGLETNPDFQVEDDITVSPALDLAGLSEAAARQNRSLRLAESQRAAAELARREIGAEWLPRVDLQLGYAFTDFTQDIGIPARQPGGFNYGLSASFDIFEGYNRSRRMENARLDVLNAQLETADLRTRLQTDLQNTYTEYQNSLALIALEQENVALAEQNVEVALEQFELGTITSIELREVQEALLDARSRLVAARFEAKRAETTLLLLSGELLDRSTAQG